MTQNLSNSGEQVTVDEVLDAIEVLSEERQKQVLEQIRTDGGITPEFGLRIAALIDEQIAAEGGLEAIDAEQKQLALLQSEIGRPVTVESMPPEIHDAMIVSELAEQEQTYGQWFQEVGNIERVAATRAEGARDQADQSAMDQLRQMLHQKPQN